MNAPICEFVEKYCDNRPIRLHMPGHKGNSVFGNNAFDITEIDGADSLFEANGIILQSQNNASKLFDTRKTFYSTEGSSLAIRAMLALALNYSKTQKSDTSNGERPMVFAARNAHRAFITASALLDFDVTWLYGDKSYLSCSITAEELESAFKTTKKKPFAVYITSPDYLGKITDVAALKSVCEKYKTLLIVDNAHGAYLKFLKESRHPIDLGADMCCDSAHKTLPVLTGGAYLHISKKAPIGLENNANEMLALFASTSPSYLILLSLDKVNIWLNECKTAFEECEERVKTLKERLLNLHFQFLGDEPLKLTLLAKSVGYNGKTLAKLLKDKNIVVEYCDEDFVVMMFSPANVETDFKSVSNYFENLQQFEPILNKTPKMVECEKSQSIRSAYLSPSRKVEVSNAEGEILSSPSVSCPPAVPIAICGEIITKEHIELFKYYGIEKVNVVNNIK